MGTWKLITPIATVLHRAKYPRFFVLPNSFHRGDGSTAFHFFEAHAEIELQQLLAV